MFDRTGRESIGARPYSPRLSHRCQPRLTAILTVVGLLTWFSPSLLAFGWAVHWDINRVVFTFTSLDRGALRFSRSAVEQIDLANRNTDLVRIADPVAHCTDERISECTQRLIDLKQNVVNALTLPIPDGIRARAELGIALGSCLCQGGFLDGHACQQRKMGNDQENQHTTKTELKDARDHFSTSLTISSTTPLDALQDTGRKGRMLPSAKTEVKSEYKNQRNLRRVNDIERRSMPDTASCFVVSLAERTDFQAVPPGEPAS